MRSSDWSSDVCSSDLLKALPDASLAGGYVLFPDPWPKKRHQWRRIVNPDTLADWARLLPRGHELRLATDVPDYQRWMLRCILGAPQFDWQVAGRADWLQRRSEEHTSELQSLMRISYAVFCLKKKNNKRK